VKPAKAGWETAFLVCGKCSKKVGGGFGRKGRTPLAKLLRKLDGFGKGRCARYGVVETKCLGLCPRDAVTLVDTRRPGEWRIVRPGADVAALGVELVGGATVSPPCKGGAGRGSRVRDTDEPGAGAAVSSGLYPPPNPPLQGGEC
jgi:hypothetical protein